VFEIQESISPAREIDSWFLHRVFYCPKGQKGWWMMNRKSTIVWVLVLVLATAGVAQADLMGYVAGDSQVISVNFTTLESVNLGPSGAQGFRSLDLLPSNNDLYVTTSGGGIYEVDTVSGLANEVVNTGNTGLDNISFNASGQLFAAGNLVGGLASINLNTGVLTTINTSPWFYTSVSAFAIDSTNTAIAWDSSAQWLFEVDMSDGNTTSLGFLSGSFEAFDFGPDGTLYAMEQFTATTGHLYSIDINTLSRSDYFGEFQYENGLAIVPEPCTLFLLGLGGLGLLRKRRA